MTCAPPSMDDVCDLRRRAGQAVADTRETGGFFYAHLVGIRGRVPAPGTASLTLGTSGPPGRSGDEPSTMAMATLVDFALGTALRSRLSPGQLLATVSLTVVLARPGSGQVAADGRVLHVDGDAGTAVCDLSDGDGAFGHAVGTFAAQRSPTGWSPSITPWEHPSPPQPASALPDALTAGERAAVEAAVAAGIQARSRRTSPCDELLDVSVSRSDEDHSVGSSSVTPALANRAGTVHGGALMALAEAVARPLLPPGGWELRELSYHFLRPAGGEALEARSHVRRRGRRSMVLEATVLSHGLDVGLAVLRFGPGAGGS